MKNTLARLLRRGTKGGQPAESTADTSGESSAAEPDESPAVGAKPAAAATTARPRTRFGAWLGRPMTSFHLIIAVAALLTTLGLTMVLSASGVRSYDDDGSAWIIFGRQVLWTIVGLVACYLALRLPVRFMRRMAFSGFALTIVMLVLVLIPGIGKEANGSRGWFVIAGFSMQPSELTKIAFAIWGAHLLAARRMERASLREMLIPLVPAAVIALALIVAQPDLGQTVSMGIILLGLFWYAGLPLRVFLSSLFATIVAAAILAVSAGYRSDRVRSWLNPGQDPQDSGYQARQAKFALANGGVFGDGLGQGTAKWNYLPNAHNDFIFAIIGEELGLVGALGLLATVRAVRLHRDADCAAVRRPVPAAADRDDHDVGDRPVVYQRGLRDRPAAGHRYPAATHLCGWNIHGHNTFDDRHDGECCSPRTRGRRRAASRTRRPDEPVAAVAAARALCADPGRGTARPAAQPAAAGQAAAQGVRRSCRAAGETARGGSSRLGTSQCREASWRRTAVHRPASCTRRPSRTGRSALSGEQLGQRANRGLLVVGGARGRRYSRPRRTRDGGRRRLGCPGSAGPHHRTGHRARFGDQAGARARLLT